MKTSRCLDRCVLFVLLLGLGVGCESQPAVNPSPNVAPPIATAPEVKPSTPAVSPFAGDEGFWHPESAVGFHFPAEWTNLGVSNRGQITSLGLRKGEGEIEVTLYWSAPDEAINEQSIGQIEWTGLKTIYADKVGSPKPITAGQKAGYRLAIDSGPLGKEESGLKGVVYVFAVNSKDTWWKIKLRATASTPEQFAEIAKLLDNYRWPEH